MSITVIAKLTFQEGTRADAIEAMSPMMEHVESEEGTTKYIMVKDTVDENVVWMYEEYADQAAFEAHGSSDAMKALGGAIGSKMAGRPELFFGEVVRGKGL